MMKLGMRNRFLTIEYLLICSGFLALPLLFIPQNVSAAESVKFVQEFDDGFIEPIDTAISKNGYVYILDKEAAKVFVFNAQGKLIRNIGASGSRQGELHRPNSLALSLNGDLIITDTGNSRVVVFKPDGTYLYELGNAGKGSGEFITPNSVAVDPLGYIFVADASKKTISRFSPKGVFLEVLPLNHKPKDLAFDVQQNMYVLMPEAGMILKIKPDGKSQEITFIQNSIDYLSRAVGMSIDMRGDIYIIENKEHSIKKISQDKQLLFSFGSKGVGRGQLNRASSVTADTLGNIYIADTKNKRVQVLAIGGSQKKSLVAKKYQAPVLDFDSSIATQKTIIDLFIGANKELYALSDHHGHVLYKGTNIKVLGKPEGVSNHLRNPKALYVDSKGEMLIADTGNNRLKFLNPDGTHDYHFGKRGVNNGEFNALEGVAINKEGFIYVSDTKNHRVQIFNRDGIYLNAFGGASQTELESGPEHGRFNLPKDLIFDSKGKLYVLDSKNKRIQIFDSQGLFLNEIGGVLDKVQFKNPVDIAIDEKDFLYVADRGSHQVYIIDPKGKEVLRFGSKGVGPSYFPKLSSIAVAKGKIYVADYAVDHVQVFNFDLNGIKIKQPKQIVQERANPGITIKTKFEKVAAQESKSNPPKEEISKTSIIQQEDRVYLTQVSYPMYFDLDNGAKYNKAKQVTLNLGVRKLARKLQVSEKALAGLVSIDAEEMLPSRQMKLTISVPKNVLKDGANLPLISKSLE